MEQNCKYRQRAAFHTGLSRRCALNVTGEIMKRLTDRQIKNRLDKIADLTNEIHAELRTRYGDGFVYFEAEGMAHAMKCDTKAGDGNNPNDILVSSKGFNFDCGAW